MPTMMQGVIADLVQQELRRALDKHGNMSSSHEAYAVVKEEFDEWWEMIMANHKDPQRKLKAAKELIQTAAMCHRALLDVYGHEVLLLERTGMAGL